MLPVVGLLASSGAAAVPAAAAAATGAAAAGGATIGTGGIAAIVVAGAAIQVAEMYGAYKIGQYIGHGIAQQLGPSIQTVVNPLTDIANDDIVDTPRDVPNDFIVVRGGVAPPPPPGIVVSGAFGPTVEDAGRGVPHNQLIFTTAEAIRVNGGMVMYKPEAAYPGGPINYRHVNFN
jgi:hypothetical protein